MPCVENGHDHRVVVVSTTDAPATGDDRDSVSAAQGLGGHLQGHLQKPWVPLTCTEIILRKWQENQ